MVDWELSRYRNPPDRKRIHRNAQSPGSTTIKVPQEHLACLLPENDPPGRADCAPGRKVPGTMIQPRNAFATRYDIRRDCEVDNPAAPESITLQQPLPVAGARISVVGVGTHTKRIHYFELAVPACTFLRPVAPCLLDRLLVDPHKLHRVSRWPLGRTTYHNLL